MSSALGPGPGEAAFVGVQLLLRLHPGIDPGDVPVAVPDDGDQQDEGKEL